MSLISLPSVNLASPGTATASDPGHSEPHATGLKATPYDIERGSSRFVRTGFQLAHGHDPNLSSGCKLLLAPGRRTYRFLSIALAVLRRVDPLAGSADRAATTLVSRTPG